MASQDLLSLVGELEVVLSGESEDLNSKRVIRCLQESKDLKFKHIEDVKQELVKLNRYLSEVGTNYELSVQKLSTSEKDLEIASAERDEEKASLKDLEDKVNDLQETLRTEEGRNNELCVELQKLGQKMKTDLPKLKSLFQLYTNISKIRWDYECNENEIKGYVCGGKDVRPINVTQSKDQTPFYSANYLWDLIETVH